VVAVTIVFVTSIDLINKPKFEKTFKSFDFVGVPYFFGICTFAFEGNTVTLEIYSAMLGDKKNFSKALALGIGMATFLFMMIGTLFYNAYGQYTQAQFIGNMEPKETWTYLVKALYGVGVTSGFIL